MLLTFVWKLSWRACCPHFCPSRDFFREVTCTASFPLADTSYCLLKKMVFLTLFFPYFLVGIEIDLIDFCLCSKASSTPGLCPPFHPCSSSARFSFQTPPLLTSLPNNRSAWTIVFPSSDLRWISLQVSRLCCCTHKQNPACPSFPTLKFFQRFPLACGTSHRDPFLLPYLPRRTPGTSFPLSWETSRSGSLSGHLNVQSFIDPFNLPPASSP